MLIADHGSLRIYGSTKNESLLIYESVYACLRITDHCGYTDLFVRGVSECDLKIIQAIIMARHPA